MAVVTIKVRVDIKPLMAFEKAVRDGLGLRAAGGPIESALRQWSARYRSFSQLRFAKLSRGGGEWPPLSDATKLARLRRTGGGRIRERAVASAESAKKRALKTFRRKLEAFEATRSKAVKIPKTTRGKKAAAARYAARVHKAAEAAEAARQRYRGLERSGRRDAVRAAFSRRMLGKFSILRDTGMLFAALSPSIGAAPGAYEELLPEGGIEVGYGGPGRHASGKGRATIADIASFHQNGGGRLPIRRIIVHPDQRTLDLMAGDMDRALKAVARSSKAE